MKFIERAQAANYHSRRTAVLAAEAARLLPEHAEVIDIGCGDGLIDRMILNRRPDLTITLCDVVTWPDSPESVVLYDGTTIPFEDRRFDCALLIDTLHHVPKPQALLQEAVRVSRCNIVIKDHLADRPFARPVLRFMDRAGNERHGVDLPFQYWVRNQWLSEFSRLDLAVERWVTQIELYPWWASWLFGWNLHFIALLGLPKTT